MSKVFLVDGNSIFFRAYHAISNLNRSDGMATNAIYGYLLALRNLLNEHQPREMVVAFDRPEKTFRSELYDAYKSNREAPPDDLIVQIPYIQNVTRFLGISSIDMPGFEADDLIGTMTSWLVNHNREVMIVSGDKDLLQLVSESVSLLRQTPNNKTVVYTPIELHERYGVSPRQFIDVLALMGDAVDNVPGVPGIGEKTASALVQQFGTLENLYDHLEQVSGIKRVENLVQNRDQAFLSQKLVTLRCDIPLDLSEETFHIRPPQVDALRNLYRELEFRSFFQELDQPAVDKEPVAYQTVDTLEQLDDVICQIKAKGICAFDTETTSLDSLRARLVGVSLSIASRQGWYIPFFPSSGNTIPRAEAGARLKEILESKTIIKIAHHSKFDRNILWQEGIRVEDPVEDTLIASNLIQPEVQSHKLDDLAERHLHMKMTPITDLIGKGKNQRSMADVEIAKVSDYACEDTDAAWRLWEYFQPQLQEDPLANLYRRVEIPLSRVLAGMERRGIQVNPDTLEEQSREVGDELARLEKAIHQSVGKEFNLNSPAQLAQILYDDLHLLSGRKRSTRADILESLAEDGVAIAQQILDYRHRQKIKSTYLDALRQQIRPETGRIHTSYHQAITNTGRISSSDPNLQNIPIRTDLGRRVRKAFVAKPGCRLLSLDYSQIELRIRAHVSFDPGLRLAFAAGEDIHQRTAAEVFGVSLGEVTPDMRRKAKEINFGLNYGMSPYGLARRLNLPDAEAARYIETYFSRYPNVRQYMEETIFFAQQHLYVLSLLGRKIPTEGIRDPNRNRQENARRAAINAPIQGSAADLLKVAMVQIDEALRHREDEASILLTVHDELVLEVREDLVEEIAGICREIMEHAMPLEVPLPVEVSVGANWAELK